MLLLAAGYYDTAETALLHARAGSPENADWAAYLGHTYRLRNEPALAVKAFADARALRPKDIVTLVHLGEMQLASGETDAAERTLGEALALDAGSARTLGALGRAALSRNDYATAISRLEQAIVDMSGVPTPLAVMFIDLDRFKLINDSFGHQSGDELLREIAIRLSNSVGERGLLARQGGDEFTLLLTEFADQAELAALAEDILTVLGRGLRLEEHEV